MRCGKSWAKANDRTWQALGIALAGDGFLDQVKVFFAEGTDRGIREQVRQFLASGATGFEGTPAQERKECRVELRKVRENQGLLSADGLEVTSVSGCVSVAAWIDLHYALCPFTLLFATAVENLWDKYRAPLLEIEVRRD
jgi:hypothetical protein